MAGIGPPPKDPATRRRRNRVASAGELPPESARRRARVPPLPPRAEGLPWHPRVVALWTALWRSPQASQFLRLDAEALCLVAEAAQEFWTAVEAKERTAWLVQLRLLLIEYGITKMALRRLQWTIGDEEGQAATRRAPPAPPPAIDPRQALRAVK